MSAYLPHKKGFAGYATRFWHPAYGKVLASIETRTDESKQRGVCLRLELSLQLLVLVPHSGVYWENFKMKKHNQTRLRILCATRSL